MITHDKHWYAIYTNPRAEKKVAQALQLNGIVCYLPLQITIKQWSDRKKKVEEPLFKSYVFVHVNLELERLIVLNTPGIVKFVRIGGENPTIRPQIIEAIKLSTTHYSEIEISTEPISINQQVRVIAGPLQGYIGVTIAQHGNKYFAIKIEELGAHLLVKIPIQYLQNI
jgi:transcription antitermination factor NusG